MEQGITQGVLNKRSKRQGDTEGFQVSVLEARYRIWEGRSVQGSEVTFATARFISSGNRYIEEGVGTRLWTRPGVGKK